MLQSVPSIVIAGDFVPTKSNRDMFESKDLAGLFGEDCIRVFAESALSIVNLETPLTDCPSPIVKWGPNLCAPSESVAVLKQLGIGIVGLSNNHIMDQGLDGLASTISTVSKAHIRHVGAGMSLDEASKTLDVEVAGKTISIYACAEHEFSIATNSGGGANPFDAFCSLDHIREAKRKADVVIVLFHGGIEQYRYPTPKLQQIAHRAIECGADVFVCQHSHCVGSYEEYKGKTIVYGQGNFLFDADDNEYWNNGLLLKVEVGDSINVEYLPIQKHGSGVRLASQENARRILNDFYQRSEQLQDSHFVYDHFEQYSEERIYELLRLFGGRLTGNILYRALNKLTRGGVTKLAYSKRDLACIIDFVRCESLNELVDAGCSKALSAGKR